MGLYSMSDNDLRQEFEKSALFRVFPPKYFSQKQSLFLGNWMPKIGQIYHTIPFPIAPLVPIYNEGTLHAA